MRLLRETIRKFKYKLKFLSKNELTSLNYNVNSSVNNKLTELMNLHGSDKGGKNNHHNFSKFYSEFFFNKRKKIKNVLEIGLGTNDPNMASNMGKEGVPLASLRAWRDYFVNANIYGADIDKNILKDEHKIKTYFVEQIGEESFDIILEDGLHEYSANICFFENSIKYLSDEGVYIIEDVYFKDKEKFIKYFKKTNYNFSVVDIYHKNNIANNCLIIIRKNV